MSKHIFVGGIDRANFLNSIASECYMTVAAAQRSLLQNSEQYCPVDCSEFDSNTIFYQNISV